ncbi:MAG: 50S ribosomal protein L10 [Pseudomonadota bacterium]
MAMDRAAKEALRVVSAGRFNKSGAAIVAEYRGLTVAELTSLRRELRKANAEFRITKNRVAKKAVHAEAESSKAVSDRLKGPVGIIYLYGDVAAGAKAADNFAKGNEKFVITGGVMEGKAVSKSDISVLASLPPKEVLLAQIIGSLVAPHRGLLGVLQGVPRNVVQVINAIKEKKA